MNIRNGYHNIRKETNGQATLELAMVIPLIIIMVLAASQIGLLVYSKITVLQASRETARMISTTNNNNLALETAKKICGKDFKISIDPGKASQRRMGEMVSVSISRYPGGLMSIIEHITGREVFVKAESSMRMECD